MTFQETIRSIADKFGIDGLEADGVPVSVDKAREWRERLRARPDSDTSNLFRVSRVEVYAP